MTTMTKQQFVKFKKSNIGVPVSIRVDRKRWGIIILPLAFSLFLQLYVSNSVAGQGRELTQIETQIEEVKRRNKVLREEIASSNSLQKVESASQALGLARPEKIEYLQPNTAIGQATTNTAFVDVRNGN